MKLLSSQEEQEIFDMLSAFSLPDVVGILTNLIKELPDDQKKFYDDEIVTWSALGNKSILINDIIDLIDAGTVLGVVDDMLDEGVPAGASMHRRKAINPKNMRDFTDNSRSEWSQDTATPRTWPSGGGGYDKDEKDRMRNTKNLTFKDPDLLNKEFVSDDLPDDTDDIDFSALTETEKASLHNVLWYQIMELVGSPKKDSEIAAPVGEGENKKHFKNLPKPYLLGMLKSYLQLTDPEYYDQAIRGISEAGGSASNPDYESATIFGTNKKNLMGKLKNKIPVEDLYSFWKAICKEGKLPGVQGAPPAPPLDAFKNGGKNLDEYYAAQNSNDANTMENFIYKRFSNDVRGRYIREQYRDWLGYVGARAGAGVEDPQIIQDMKRKYTIEDIGELDDVIDIPEIGDEDIEDEDIPIEEELPEGDLDEEQVNLLLNDEQGGKRKKKKDKYSDDSLMQLENVIDDLGIDDSYWTDTNDF